MRLFRVGADVFAQLQRGETIIHSTLAGSPQRAQVLRAELPDIAPPRLRTGERHACELAVHPAETLQGNDNDDKPSVPKPQPAAKAKVRERQAQRLFDDV